MWLYNLFFTFIIHVFITFIICLVKGAITLKPPVVFGITPNIVTLDDMPT